MASSHSNTPSKKSSLTSTSRGSDTPYMSLTPSEQDRQARGQNPYLGNDDDDDDFSDGYSGEGRFDAYGEDTYENIQKRREAAVILDSPELLMMHAQARGDSIPGTRHYFTKLLCGYQSETDSYSEPSTKEFMAKESRNAFPDERVKARRVRAPPYRTYGRNERREGGPRRTASSSSMQGEGEAGSESTGSYGV